MNLNLNINLDKYLGIIFDLDGTLINSMGAHEDPWQQTCEYFALPFNADWVYQLGGMPSRKVAVETVKRYGLVY